MIYSAAIKALISTTLLVDALTCLGEETNATSSRYLRQQPTGSKTSWTISTNSKNQIVYHMTNRTSGSNWIVNGGPVPISLPYTYSDTNAGVHLRVEADGRHITSIGPSGNTNWCRDPFTEARLEFYRTTNPKIRFIGKTGNRGEEYWAKQGKTVVSIVFDSSQFGNLDVKTGDFFFGGQN